MHRFIYNVSKQNDDNSRDGFSIVSLAKAAGFCQHANLLVSSLYNRAMMSTNIVAVIGDGLFVWRGLSVIPAQ